MQFEPTTSLQQTITWNDECNSTEIRPPNVKRVTEGGCTINANSLGIKRKGDAPAIYTQALAAGECGPLDERELPAAGNNRFGKYINAGHLMGDQFGGPMGNTDEETAIFFAQNNDNNKWGLWAKMEKCLVTCIRTVPAIIMEGATLSWEVHYDASVAAV